MMVERISIQLWTAIDLCVMVFWLCLTPCLKGVQLKLPDVIMFRLNGIRGQILVRKTNGISCSIEDVQRRTIFEQRAGMPI
ncbi:hypothetical protein DPMN_158894 [Dreissena polymorpha]|uniref:Uncharacterized protein n=1 Tax=Dreissena polymorpha TaxID=45954 RepID=A0A9D4IQ78_DREPO|nr:hypothetical protein DPMN_158894 [Dreissena polymorpha]